MAEVLERDPVEIERDDPVKVEHDDRTASGPDGREPEFPEELDRWATTHREQQIDRR